MNWLQRCALIPLCLMAAFCGASAADYPTRNVSILVPFAPGGGTDLIARMVGQKLGERLGKSFIVENRPGAGTWIAAGETAKAAPDGYTLMQATSGISAQRSSQFMIALLHERFLVTIIGP